MTQTHDVVIIGGGVAGLSAGLYTVRAKLDTLLIERTVMGGQIINSEAIENYPGFPHGVNGVELVAAIEEQASKFGLQYGFGEVTALDVSKRPFVIRTEEEEHRARSVIIAAGGDHVKLGVPGEQEYEAKGVSYCATCDGNFFTGQEVVVVGGGDSAVEEAVYLTRMCTKVTVVHRRDQLRAAKILQERAFANPKVEFVWNTVVEEIQGNGSVSGVALRNLKTEEKRRLPATGVFVYVGFNPNSRPFQGVVPMDAGGHIKVDLMMHTEIPGVFAVGDIRWKSTKQLANAAGDGVTAALAAYEYLEQNR
ncbi:MAG: thioredoxin-disulfide reductase [Dehalococcoidia bacterium]|nr:thioredoxin-disulfide reductase [Dehalococcoidia bacterium]